MPKWAFLSLLLSFGGFANQTSADFKAFKEYAKSLKSQPESAMHGFNPQSLFDHYTEHPAQEGHYQGIQTEKTDLASSAKAAIPKESGAQTVVEHFGEKRFELNSSSAVLSSSQRIEEESYAITHGISNERVSCDSQKPKCELKTHEEHCMSARLLPEQTCTKTRKVFVDTEKIVQRADFSFVVDKKWTGIVMVNLLTGAITHALSGNVPSPIHLHYPCAQLHAVLHSILNNGAGADWVEVIDYPSCANNGVITFSVNKPWGRVYTIEVALTVIAHSHPYIASEYWENNCTDFEKKGALCHVKKESCTDNQPTKVMDGLPITRDCWAKDLLYACKSQEADECIALKNKGCLQIGSMCARFENNYCVLYQQTYSCQEEECLAPVACVKDLFCADGECTEHTQTQNSDFGQSVSSLAVMGEAGKAFSAQPGDSLFAGKAVQCKIWRFDLIDCCHNKGWGKDIHLLHCRDEDKALGQAKLNYVAHYVGRFCSKKVAGVCVEYKHSYCVFPSKMARIIQEARLSQINAAAFGEAKEPHCEGMPLAELERLNLDRVDFVIPIYPYAHGTPNRDAGIAGDIQIKSKDSQQLLKEVTQRLQKKAGEL